MDKILKILLSIKNIDISKDCIGIIGEYLYFSIKHVENIDRKYIKLSKYYQEFDTELRNNIGILEKYPTNKSENGYLNVIRNNILEIYKNNKLIESIEFNLKSGNQFVRENDNIFVFNKKTDIIRVIDINSKREKRNWSINNDTNEYKGCLSVVAYNGKIYVVTYGNGRKYKRYKKIMIKYVFYLNIYSDSGLLLKNLTISKDLHLRDFSLRINNDIIFLQYINNYNCVFDAVFEKNFIYDMDLNLIYSEENCDYKDLYPLLNIIQTENNLILICTESYKIYKFEKMKIK
jgi:hypothetical protein